MITLKRVYDPLSPEDGARVLVDRIWPRGKKREDLQLYEWMKELAPSVELRKWFGHREERWEEFVQRYKQELDAPDKRARLRELRQIAGEKGVTLLYSAKDREHNQAIVIKDMLMKGVNTNG